MKQKNRNIEIFSLSALDIFASGMGAFMLIAIILFPYYQNHTKVTAEVDALRTSVKELEQDNSKLRKEAEEKKLTVFIGLTSKAKRIIMLVDMSGSMEKYSSLMTETVRRLLAPLDDSHSIQVIGFQGEVPAVLTSWKNGRVLTPMSRNNKTLAAKFASSLTGKFGGRTPTAQALNEALQYTNPQAVFLLSDGAPNTAINSIVNDFTSRNKNRSLPLEVNTIALGDYFANPKLVNFMQDLAKKNNGQYIGISQ